MDDDFLLGRDILPTLFPNDEALRYCPPHSSITDTPRNVVSGDANNDSDSADDADDDEVYHVNSVTATSASSSQ